MNKRKLLTLALTLCMVAILAVGGTLAYFSESKSLTNTFTAGNVHIKLDEAVVEKDDNGDYVQDEDASPARTENNQSYILHPGQTVLKDPTITNTGSLPAYVAAKITVDCKGLDTLIAKYPPYIDITQLVTGGIATAGADYMPTWNGFTKDGIHKNDSCIAYQVPNAAEGEWVIYLLMNAPLAANGEVELFNTITIPETYNNTQMEILNNMSIKVEAYAVQTEGFVENTEFAGNCYDAMHAAFPKVFSF